MNKSLAARNHLGCATIASMIPATSAGGSAIARCLSALVTNSAEKTHTFLDGRKPFLFLGLSLGIGSCGAESWLL
jgi:hypothetical protein